MKLYILRHAHAHPGKPDSERPVSPKGRDTIERLARFLKATKYAKPAVIHHSTLLRAKQTARILTAEMQWLIPTHEFSGMEPASPVSSAAQLYNSIAENTLLVGHEPHLSRLISHLLTGSEKAVDLQLKKGGLVCLEKSEKTVPHWKLLWSLPPKFYR